MSRIGKNPITITEGVTVTLQGTVVTVKGKLGELSQDIDVSITVTITDNVIVLARESDDKEHRSKHGLYRALIANMIEGNTNTTNFQGRYSRANGKIKNRQAATLRIQIVLRAFSSPLTFG